MMRSHTIRESILCAHAAGLPDTSVSVSTLPGMASSIATISGKRGRYKGITAT
jgi:hypothetical protein